MPAIKIPDQNGYITVKGVPLTKAGVYEYMGSELGAPEPDRIYKVYRPADELESADTVESFKLAPFIDDHEWLGETGTPAERKGIQGTIGEQVYFEYPYLRGNVRIHSESLQSKIKSGKVELSAGYACRYVPEQGEYKGQPYEYVQRNIRANHLALVDKGRSGADVNIALDQQFTITLDTAELITMTIEDIIKALATLSDDDKAKLAAALAVEDEQGAEQVDDEDEKSEDVIEASETAEEIEEAVNVVEAAKEAAELVDNEGEDEDKSEDTETSKTEDALRKEIAQLRKELKAMDTASMLKEIGKRDALANRLSEYVGTFDHSGMTTQQVAQYGIKKLGIQCAKGYETIALDAWMQGRVPARKAQDEAPKADFNKFWSK